MVMVVNGGVRDVAPRLFFSITLAWQGLETQFSCLSNWKMKKSTSSGTKASEHPESQSVASNKSTNAESSARSPLLRSSSIRLRKTSQNRSTVKVFGFSKHSSEIQQKTYKIRSKSAETQSWNRRSNSDLHILHDRNSFGGFPLSQNYKQYIFRQNNRDFLRTAPGACQNV